MRRGVDHADLAAAGYFAEWSLTPGSVARFHLSSADSGAAVRILRLDRAPCRPVDWPIAGTGTAPGPRSLDLGSWLGIERHDSPPAAGAWSLAIEFRLSEPPRDRVLIATGGLEIGFDRSGALTMTGAAGVGAAAGGALPARRWMIARLRQAAGTATLAIAERPGGEAIAALDIGMADGAPREIRIGAAAPADRPTLNAAIGRITLYDAEDHPILAWRFPPVGRPETLPAAPGGGATLRVHNAPTYASRSPRWDGSTLDPRLSPDHYDAVSLHDDDLADAGWPQTHAIAIPVAAESGIYAAEVEANGSVTRWPLFVTAAAPSAALAFLAPTFTYLAYANERLPPERFPWLGDDRGHRFARANGLTSLYDTHNDGSGVSLASFRRPLATIRDDYRYPLCGAPHLLPVDLHLLRFLAEHGLRVDIVTDADLDRDGPARLRGYRALVTGSHPEYWSLAMLDAAVGFRAGGGHIAYLGGNGCYWVTASDGKSVEVRRGTSGIRTWSSEPGESHLATTGEPGGLWRHRGRAEHRLLGVGLAAMGFTQARPYRRTPRSFAPDLAWLFAGVGEAPIGDAGIVLGGAAGYEIDARSARWETPDAALLLAVAEGFDDGYVVDPDASFEGGPPPVRGEMVLTRPSGGGMVFAAGSVSWCGALPDSAAMNPVGQITLNLLRRFAS